MSTASKFLSTASKFLSWLTSDQYGDIHSPRTGNQQWKPALRMVHSAKKGTYLSFPPLTRNKGARKAETYRGYRRNRDLRVHGAQWIGRNVYLDV